VLSAAVENLFRLTRLAVPLMLLVWRTLHEHLSELAFNGLIIFILRVCANVCKECVLRKRVSRHRGELDLPVHLYSLGFVVKSRLCVLKGARGACFVLLSGGQMAGLTTVCWTCYAETACQNYIGVFISIGCSIALTVLTQRLLFSTGQATP